MPFANGNNCLSLVPKGGSHGDCVIGDEVGGLILGVNCGGSEVMATQWQLPYGEYDGCQRNCDGFMEEDKMQLRFGKLNRYN
ncbi:MAG: hypothetical protein IPI90_15645 [Saprospiraceae bacterium]|nr:hypothetical protein [Candidatus Vicinibacter affinis]